MTNEPVVSVIVPTWNRPELLKRALMSISSQSFENFECLIIDDNSEIDNALIVSKFDSRFKIHKNESNLGVSGTRLVGFKLAKGQIIAQLDDDNTFYPWTLQRMVSILNETPSISGVSGLYLFHDGLRARVKSSKMIIDPKAYASGKYFDCDMVGAVRSQVTEEWLTKSSTYKSFDGHLWISYHMQHSHMYVDEPWGEYMEDGTNRITKQKVFRNPADLRLFTIEHKPLFGLDACVPLDNFLIVQRLRYRKLKHSDVQIFQEWLTERGLPYWKIYMKGLISKLTRMTFGSRKFD